MSSTVFSASLVVYARSLLCVLFIAAAAFVVSGGLRSDGTPAFLRAPQPFPPSEATASLPKCACVGIGARARCWPRAANAGGRPFRILFHSNQFGPRGTEIAMFDYASAFEDLLGGVAHIDTFAPGVIEGVMPFPQSMISQPKFEARFPGRVHLLAHDGRPNPELDALLASVHADAFYAIQFGLSQYTLAWPTPDHGGPVRTLLHSVGPATDPHWDAYAAVSESVSVDGVPVVPHIANAVGVQRVGSSEETPPRRLPSLRAELHIPLRQSDNRTIVVCRHGGIDTMNIMFAREALCTHARSHAHTYFLLLGTLSHACEGGLANVIHLPMTSNETEKAQFLEACDVCLHAREDGESFGLSVAECSMAGLPVITRRATGPGGFHVTMLGQAGLLYDGPESLLNILDSFNTSAHAARADEYRELYANFSAPAVMDVFFNVFGLWNLYNRAANPYGLSWEGNCTPIISLPGP
jgi:hypothetical protein